MDELKALAQRCGIESSFVDAHGVAQETAPDTRRALLAAMGIRADSDETARDELRPYSPASRLLLNVLNIDVAGLARESGCQEALSRIRAPEFQRALGSCRNAHNVDYSGVAQLKLPLLKTIFHARTPTLGPRCAQFATFRREAGAAFERSCLFLALRAHFADETPALPDWRRWPAEFRDPQSPLVQQFAETHAEDVTFQAWLQFIADRQLQEAARAAEPMAIGLYRDLAVGADPSGADTWSNQLAVPHPARRDLTLGSEERAG